MERALEADEWRHRANRRRIAATLLSMVCVLTLTHIPPAAMPTVRISAFDKCAHVTAYMVVTIFFFLGIGCWTRHKFPLLLPLGLGTMAVFDELTQPLVHRHASLADLAADLIGIATIYVIIFLWSCRKPKAYRSVADGAVVYEVEGAERVSNSGKT